MRYADRREDDLGMDEELIDPAATRPDLSAVDSAAWRRGDPAAPVREHWRAELAAVGGPSPLLHFVDDVATRIELSTTHPGGLARFITGASTLLSSSSATTSRCGPRASPPTGSRRRDSSSRAPAASTPSASASDSLPGRGRAATTARRSCCVRSRSAATAATSS